MSIKRLTTIYYNELKGGFRFKQLANDIAYIETKDKSRYQSTKEPETVQWVNSLPVGAIFWDIGANCGSYTLYAALEQNCTVLAFEPSFSNYDALNTNILLNAVDNKVRAYCIAFHDTISIEGLKMQKTIVGSAGSSFEDPIDHKGEVFEPVFVQGMIGISIDRFVKEYSVNIPNAIKIDVDGNEDKILQGAKETLKDNKVRFISIELNEAQKDYIQRVNNLLYECGFTFMDKAITCKNRLNEKDYNQSSDQNHNYHFEKLCN